MANRQYKDSVFRMFMNNPVELAKFYQAIRPDTIIRPEDIQINTLEDIMLDELKHEGNRGQDTDRGDVTGVFYVFHDVSPPHFVYCVSSGTPGLRQAGPSSMQKATRDSSSE